MKSVFKVILVCVAVLAAYLLLWPVPIEPKSWQAPSAPELVGDYAVNSQLANFEALELDGLSGPEAIAGNAKGDIYLTTHEGWILKLAKGSNKTERWVNVSGRPLGIAFDSVGNLWVANAYLGLQKIDTQGQLSLEATVAESIPILYADDLVVTPNGKVYFSDASTKFPAGMGGGTLSASLLDLMEHGLHGRIIEFDPVTKDVKVIMRDLSFANGVSSDKNGNFLLVAETGSYRVWKYWLKGAKAGQSEVLIDNLPGFPDNIHRGREGRYWVGLTSPRSKILDDLAEKPFLRKIVQRLPSTLRPAVQPYGHILAIDKDGKLLNSMQDPSGAYPATTGAWETKEHLYVSSLTASSLARIKISDLEL